MRNELREWRHRQRRDLELRRNWNGGAGGRNPATSPMYGRRRGGREQPSVAVIQPNGRHVTLDITGQTWDGAFDFGTNALQDLGWSGDAPLAGDSDEATSPATGYYDLHLDLLTSEADDVTLTLEVDGQVRWSKTLDVFLSLNGVLAIGEWRRGQTLQLLTNKPVTVAGGRVSMQLVDRQVGRVEEPAGCEHDLDLWAWARVPRLVEDGQSGAIDEWPDSAESGPWLPLDEWSKATLVEDVLDGQPGVRNDEWETRLNSDGATDLIDGATFILVVKDWGEHDWAQMVFFDGDRSNPRCAMWVERGSVDVVAHGALSLIWSDTWPAHTAVLVGVVREEALELWHNGVMVEEISGWPTGFGTVPIQQAALDFGEELGESAVLDAMYVPYALSPAEIADHYGYARCVWPSLPEPS